MSALRAKLRSAKRGYTIVEVLSAMTLFAIGAAGVISMQRVTIQGGDDARRMDVATNIANEWLFRLQRDSAYWTKPNSAFPSDINISETAWLKDCPDATISAWIDPLQPDGYVGRSGAFDLFGQDLATGSGGHMFCAQYRLQWLVSPGKAPTLRAGALMRAEVRVFWARLDNPNIGDCKSRAVSPDDASARNYYHFVYATTAIRPNPSQ